MTDASVRLIAAAAALVGGTVFPAMAIGAIGIFAMRTIGRNPEARGAVLPNMIMSIAFAEAIAIYALITAIIIALVA
jgi:F-type H+-transporting ATPase subunit c